MDDGSGALGASRPEGDGPSTCVVVGERSNTRRHLPSAHVRRSGDSTPVWPAWPDGRRDGRPKPNARGPRWWCASGGCPSLEGLSGGRPSLGGLSGGCPSQGVPDLPAARARCPARRPARCPARRPTSAALISPLELYTSHDDARRPGTSGARRLGGPPGPWTPRCVACLASGHGVGNHCAGTCFPSGSSRPCGP